MKNQFFYTQKRQLEPQKGDTEAKFGEFRDSFNLHKVVRTGTYEDGTVAVYLDDFCEREVRKPHFNTKKNTLNGYKNIKEVTQSEIILNKEDGERYFNLTNIE